MDFIHRSGKIISLTDLQKRLLASARDRPSRQSDFTVDDVLFQCRLSPSDHADEVTWYAIRTRHESGLIEAVGTSLLAAFAQISETVPSRRLTLYLLREPMRAVEARRVRYRNPHSLPNLRESPAKTRELEAPMEEENARMYPIPVEPQPPAESQPKRRRRNELELLM